MQVAGVVDIQNMYNGKVPEITLEMVLLHCSNNSITFPIGFLGLYVNVGEWWM